MSRRVGRSRMAALLTLVVTAFGTETATAGANATYTYDALGRAISVTYSNGDAVTYAYDAAGNRTQLTVTSATPAPTVSAKSISTNYNTAGAVNLAPSGIWSSIAFPTSPTKGTLSLSGSTVTYTPNAGTSGSDSFTFTATGRGGTSAPATVSVTVIAPAPTVTAKSISTAYNTAGAVNLAPSGVYNSVAVASGPTKGSVSVSGTTATYTPTAGTYGADSFTFTATGPGGTSAPATVSVTVANPSAPTVSNVSVTTAYNTAVVISGAPAGVWTTVNRVTSPTNGAAVGDGNKSWTYTPNGGFYGVDSWTYTATGPGGVSAPATATVTVGAPAAPTAQNLSASTAYNTAVNVTASPSGVYTGMPMDVGPTKGTITGSGLTWTYTPASNFYGGADSWTYHMVGPGGNSPTYTATVTVGAPAAPTAQNLSASTAYNTAVNVTASPSGVYTGMPMDVGPTKGTITGSGLTWTYTPASNFYGGTDSWIYHMVGPGGNSPTYTATVTVGAPAAPTAQNLSASTAYNTAVNVTASPSGVYTGMPMDVGPTKGTITGSGLTWTYTPASNLYGGTDSWTYHMVGPGGNSPAYTATVTVGAPAAPTVSAKAISTAYNTAGAVDLAPSGLWSSIAFPAAPTKGTLSLSGSTVTYTPTAGTSGADSFTFTAAGPGGTSAPASVSVSVAAPPNSAPVCPATKTMNMGSIPVALVSTTVSELQLISQIPVACSDPDGDAMTLVSVSNFTRGATGSLSNGVVYINGISGGGGTTFTYVVSDGHGGQTSGSFTAYRN